MQAYSNPNRANDPHSLPDQLTAGLVCIGWTGGDGSGHDGYNVADYFAADGRYLGPDEHGIEPIFAAAIAKTEGTP